MIVALGPRARSGQSVLDLGCGDGIMAAPLGDYGLLYSGVDSSEQMVEAARRRHPGLGFARLPLRGVRAARAGRRHDLPARVLLPRGPGRASSAGSARYTRGKFVFDFREAVHPRGPIVRDLQAAGFSRIELRPFFTPQSRRIPAPALPLLDALERTRPARGRALARLGRIFCSASA